ncbi:hypothetical protein [Chroococcus sp. FPU101]|uniref:hypothetical protein n=1 Tax=Chroococcus sp. FPU101 TaxID=1974212 RepID=UPI001A8DD437|nr:hypothetical protein [Chroococcus sp. FPU101]GFE70062.1 hypothetical protein CFPU101_26720 [Chroococcus sp. FPU101]
MFLDELQPLMKELIQQPIAFAGGFFSGLLRLKITDEPLKSWLGQQGMMSSPDHSSNNNGNSPQSIDID